MRRKIRIGIAGWSVPASHRSPALRASHLEQYSAHFDCVEINSSFYKPHLAATYIRWAATVPQDFRFSVKVPKSITHEQRLIACEGALARFCGAVDGLGEKLEVLLVQLPPSLAFDGNAAETVFSRLRQRIAAKIVCEARHPSWFDPDVARFLRSMGIVRALADPPVCPRSEPASPTEWAYFRLHGRPRVYYSSYSAEDLRDLASELRTRPSPSGAWCIFDNTAQGAAWPNALRLKCDLAAARGRPTART